MEIYKDNAGSVPAPATAAWSIDKAGEPWVFLISPDGVVPTGSPDRSGSGRWTRELIAWSAAERGLGRAAAVTTLLVFISVACAGSAGDARSGNRRGPASAGGSVEIPRSGVFPTSVDHFDRVIESGALPTVVNAWASWCIPCRAETPLFVKAAARYEGKLRFLGLNTQDDRKAALAFIEEFGIPYASGLDPSGKVARHLRILGLPATFFYRPGGELALVHQGEIRASDLNEKIGELLRVSATTAAGPSP